MTENKTARKYKYGEKCGTGGKGKRTSISERQKRRRESITTAGNVGQARQARKKGNGKGERNVKDQDRRESKATAKERRRLERQWLVPEKDRTNP